MVVLLPCSFITDCTSYSLHFIHTILSLYHMCVCVYVCVLCLHAGSSSSVELWRKFGSLALVQVGKEGTTHSIPLPLSLSVFWDFSFTFHSFPSTSLELFCLCLICIHEYLLVNEMGKAKISLLTIKEKMRKRNFWVFHLKMTKTKNIFSFSIFT